jgi:hypothetical protein
MIEYYSVHLSYIRRGDARTGTSPSLPPHPPVHATDPVLSPHSTSTFFSPFSHYRVAAPSQKSSSLPPAIHAAASKQHVAVRPYAAVVWGPGSGWTRSRASTEGSQHGRCKVPTPLNGLAVCHPNIPPHRLKQPRAAEP